MASDGHHSQEIICRHIVHAARSPLRIIHVVVGWLLQCNATRIGHDIAALRVSYQA